LIRADNFFNQNDANSKQQVCKDKGQKRDGPGTGVVSENKINVLKTAPDGSTGGS